MDGTYVTINQSQQVKAFFKDNKAQMAVDSYKTVNIYCISLSSWQCIVEKLDQHVSDGKINEYYEVIFTEMIADGTLSFEIVSFDSKPWYEIDTIEDLKKAEKLFPRYNHTAYNHTTVPVSNNINFI